MVLHALKGFWMCTHTRAAGGEYGSAGLDGWLDGFELQPLNSRCDSGCFHSTWRVCSTQCQSSHACISADTHQQYRLCHVSLCVMQSRIPLT